MVRDGRLWSSVTSSCWNSGAKVVRFSQWRKHSAPDRQILNTEFADLQRVSSLFSYVSRLACALHDIWGLTKIDPHRRHPRHQDLGAWGKRLPLPLLCLLCFLRYYLFSCSVPLAPCSSIYCINIHLPPK